MESSDMWLVLFVSATNSYESIKPEWEQAEMELSGKFNMGKVFSKDLALQCGVKSFPTIMYFPKGHKSDAYGNGNYEGDITANGIVTWALKFYNGKTKVNCMIYCDKTLRPVCGSNGKTYPNKCVFDGAKCKDNSIELAYEGLCLTPKTEEKCNKLKALGKCTEEKVLLGCKTICNKIKSPDDAEKNQDENESTETKELSSQESLGKTLLKIY